MTRLHLILLIVRRRASTLILLALSLAAEPLSAGPTLHTVEYDHSTGSLTCTQAGIRTQTCTVTNAGVCVLSIRDGDIVALRVTKSVGGLFSLNVTRTNKPLVAVPRSAAAAIGIPSGAGVAIEGDKRAAPTIVEAFNDYSEAFANIQKNINSSTFSTYGGLRDALEKARRALISALEPAEPTEKPTPFDPASVAKAMKTKSPATDETSVAARIREIESFRASTSETFRPTMRSWWTVPLHSSVR